jgi:hypothetical protein
MQHVDQASCASWRRPKWETPPLQNSYFEEAPAYEEPELAAQKAGGAGGR